MMRVLLAGLISIAFVLVFLLGALAVTEGYIAL